jgi:hypothetical protein
MGPVGAVLLRHEHHFDNLVPLGHSLLLQILFTGGEQLTPPVVPIMRLRETRS